MPKCYISIRDVKAYRITGGVKLVVTTDIACHLFMRWSLVPPQAHTVPLLRRGLYMHGDRYYCFVAYHDNEQQEAGDTIEHSFIKVPWVVCECRYFHFWGMVGLDVCVSNSPCFMLHLEEEAPPQVHEYLSCWHNRHLVSNHGTWSTARNGAALLKDGDYQRPNSILYVLTLLNASFYLRRAYQNFDTHILPIGANIDFARLGLYVTGVPGLDTTIHITKGLWNEPVVASDWALQTAEITSLGSRLFTPADIGKYVYIDLNATGIAWINQRPTENKQFESYDWAKNMHWPIHGNNYASQSFTPQTSHIITQVRLRISRLGLPGTINIRIYEAGADHCPIGAPKASGTLDANTLTTANWGDWYLIDLGAGAYLDSGTEYCIVIEAPAGTAAKQVKWWGSTGNNYPNGDPCYSVNAGGSWTPYIDQALYFIEYSDTPDGGTKFCLRTASDLGDSPPGVGQHFDVRFHSAQKGVGFYPILELTLS